MVTNSVVGADFRRTKGACCTCPQTAENAIMPWVINKRTIQTHEKVAKPKVKTVCCTVFEKTKFSYCHNHDNSAFPVFYEVVMKDQSRRICREICAMKLGQICCSRELRLSLG